MQVSEPITPVRFYNDYNNQFRFTRDCEKLIDNPLVYNTRELPFFQFKRGPSIASPFEFYIRNTCTDKEQGFYKAFPEAAANMEPDRTEAVIGPLPLKEWLVDDGVNPPYIDNFPGFEYDCAKIKSIQYDPDIYSKTGVDPVISFNVAACYGRIKVTIDAFQRVPGSNFTIVIFDGIFALQNITGPGAYTFDFLPGTTTISLIFAAMEAGDYVEISHLQWQVFDLRCAQIPLNDVVLDVTKLKTTLLDDGSQIITYCEANQNYLIEPGEYYYVIKCHDVRLGGYEFYYSETFEIKSIKEIQNYYRFRWWHTCDIENSVLYSQSILDCFYFHTVFLNTSLFKPEYPTTKEITEDGAGNQTALLSKWEKTLNFECIIPEFLTDALTAMFMHDNVYLLRPINMYDQFQEGEIKIRSIEQEVAEAFSGCYQQLNLKLLLQENYTDTSCCHILDVHGDGFRYSAHNDCTLYHEYRLLLHEVPEDGDGLISCETETLVPVTLQDIIYNNDTDRYYRLEQLTGNMYGLKDLMPKITNVDGSETSYYAVTGIVLPFTFAYIEYKLDAGDWLDSMVTSTPSDTGVFTVNVPASLAASADTFQIRIHMVDLDNDYGYSDEVIVFAP